MPQFAIQKPSQIRQCATSKLLGRSTASTGPVEELTATTAKGVLGLENVDTAVSDVFSLTNGVTSQTFSVANTFTDASNYERLALRWSSNVAIIDTQSSGTGSTRDLDIMRNGSRKIRFGSTVKVYASLRFNSNSYDIGERVNLSAPRHIYINQSFNCGNSSTAGSVTVNNLWDDSTNFETLKFSWDSNTAKIGTVADGTGSVRPLEIHGGDLTLSAANIQITNLPTSDPGVANQIWNDSGTLKISAG